MYFTFKGVSSVQMGVTVQTVSLPLVPAVKKIEYSPAFMDGSIDYSDMDGLHYEDKVFVFRVQFRAEDLKDMRLKFSGLAAWLSGKGDLTVNGLSVLGDNFVYENARVYDGITTMPQLYGRYAEFEVQFRVPPFGLAEEVSEVIEFTDAVVHLYRSAATQQDIYPMLKIYADTADSTAWRVFEFNGFRFGGAMTKGADVPVIVNGDKKTVTYGGENFLGKTNLVFPKLAEGSNEIVISADFSGRVEMSYRGKRFI